METRIELEVGREHNKTRLDDFLFEQFRNLSKMYLRELIKLERCEVNGRIENRGHKLRESDFVEIVVDTMRETAMMPEDIPINIVFEDADLIVIDKPAGMLVHPTHRDKTGTLLNGLNHYLNQPFSSISADPDSNADEHIRPGLIHRLDKQTSGLMVVAKNSRTHRIMSEQFRRKRVEKRYLAIVDGILEPEMGTISLPIGRFAELKLWDVKTDGKPAETNYSAKQRYADSTLVELEPVTGRTNQLRIHSAAIGHPIVGDTARSGREFEKLCLLAARLTFDHPRSRERIAFESSSASEFAAIGPSLAEN